MISELSIWQAAMTSIKFEQKLGFKFKKSMLFDDDGYYRMLESSYLVLASKLLESIKA